MYGKKCIEECAHEAQRQRQRQSTLVAELEPAHQEQQAQRTTTMDLMLDTEERHMSGGALAGGDGTCRMPGGDTAVRTEDTGRQQALRKRDPSAYP
mmetsp:Transcript_8824/g.18108  ORF Transcript_8824/g.18108 Transcript_8824/m.18108 type:complete len:96 (-) Transcript_8824:275-562(-)